MIEVVLGAAEAGGGRLLPFQHFDTLLVVGERM
jgi:hypothetical protein